MSIKIMNRVWSLSDQKGSALLLLLAIADNCNDSGTGFPGIQYLAHKTRMSERNIQYLLQSLDKTDELAVEWNAGRGSSNFYHILTGLPDPDIQVVKAEVARKNKARGSDERVQKIRNVRSKKKGANFAPILEDDIGENFAPIKDGKGAKSSIKGAKSDGKGAIAIAPEPLNQLTTEEDKEIFFVDAWAMLIDQLRFEMNRGVFSYYITALRPVGMEDDTFYIQAQDDAIRAWVAARLERRIRHLLEGIYQKPVKVEIRTA